MKDLVFQRQIKLKMESDYILNDITFKNNDIIKIFYNLASNTVRIQLNGNYYNELHTELVQNMLTEIDWTPHMESIIQKNQLEGRFENYSNNDNYLLKNGKMTAKFIKDNYKDLMFIFNCEVSAYDPWIQSLMHIQAAELLNYVAELGSECNEEKYFAMPIEIQRILFTYAKDEAHYNEILKFYKRHHKETK